MLKQTAILLGLVALTLSLNAQAQFRPGGDRPAQVMVQPLSFAPEQSRVDVVGSAEAKQSVTIFPAVADRVTAVHFKPGDQVEAGQLLLELDARRQRVAVERAKIQLADAERTVKRLQESRALGAVPQSELDNAVTARDLLKVTLDEAQVELEDRYVRAPFHGVLGLSDVEVGDRITTQTPVTTIDDRSQLLIDFRAPEAALALLREQPMVTLQPWTNRDKQLTGQVAEVDSRVNAENRTIRARALLDNPEDLYRPGMSFRVSLTIQGNRYAVIPEAALQWDATGAYIWISEAQKAKRVDVQIKQRRRGEILVDAPVPQDTLLITEGVQTVRAGQALQFEGNAGAAS